MRNTLAILALAVAASSQATLLHDNGAWVTGIGNGANGANTSVITSPGTTLGHTVNHGANFALGDDFTVGAGETWTLNSLTFYAYQTQANGNPPTSTITSARAAIFSAPPTNLTNNLLGGSLSANGTITSNVWSGVYRVSSTTLTNNQRALIAVTVDLGGIVVGPGTYWAGWSAAGSVASGPFAPPVSAYGGTNNGIQWNGTLWAATTDAGAALATDMAFQIEGEAVPEPATMLVLGGAVAAFARRRKK